MMTDHWLQSALTNDVIVAELLLRAKHSQDSDSLHTPPKWGHRKNRNKKRTAGKDQRGSPTTHLSWSGGSASDPSDLSSGSRSIKVNEGPSTSSCNRFQNEISHINKIDDQNPIKKMKFPFLVTKSCRVEAETECSNKGFILPDLNMAPDEEDMGMMMIS